MIGISQLLQVLQGAESAHPQPGGAAVKPSQGGFAKLFGAFIEQARAAPGEQATLPVGSAVVQAETGTELQESGEVEGGDGLAPDFVGLPVEHAASVLEALDKFETLPIEHAISVLEALSARGEAALMDGGEDSIPGDSEIVEDVADAGDIGDTEDTGDTGEVVDAAIPGTVNSVDEVVGELLAAMSVVPVQAVPSSEDGTATQAPVLATQPGRAPAQASLGALHGASAQVLLDSGLSPGSALLKAAAKSAAQEGPTPDPRGSGVAAPPVVEGESASRPTMGDVFVRAVARGQAQAQSGPGVVTAQAETSHLESLEALSAGAKPLAVKAQGAPAQAPALPGGAELVQAAAAPKGDAVLPQSVPERPPPEVVHVRQVGDFTVKTVRYLAGRNGEVVTIRLVPRSLGELHIAVRTVGQSLEVVMTAATHAAREAIEAQLPGLREALGRGGLDVMNVTVQTSTAGDQAPGHSATSGHAAGTGTKFTGGRAESEAEPRGSPRGRPEHEGSLNMFV